MAFKLANLPTEILTLELRGKSSIYYLKPNQLTHIIETLQGADDGLQNCRL